MSTAAVHPARRDFQVESRRRGAYDGAVMYDVQLQVAATGALAWAQTFSDEAQARAFEDQVEEDLDALDSEEFRRRYGVPPST